MRKAVIDLGTNTFNILIADIYDKKFRIVYTEKEGVNLGMGGINKNTISPDAFKRGLATLRRFKAICEIHKALEINAFGTSALRDAENSSTFLKDVFDELGINISIISGKEEAELIYKGVNWSYAFSQPGVIMDIGGGSTEFIFANKDGITDLISLNIGVSRIYQELKFEDPLSQKNIQSIYNWLDEKANGFFDNKQEDLLIGASGSFETFYELIHHKNFPTIYNSVEVSIEELNYTIETIIKSSQADRDVNKFIVYIRKNMAPIAAVKVKWLIEKLGIKRILISPFSLKEGALK